MAGMSRCPRVHGHGGTNMSYHYGISLLSLYMSRGNCDAPLICVLCFTTSQAGGCRGGSGREEGSEYEPGDPATEIRAEGVSSHALNYMFADLYTCPCRVEESPCWNMSICTSISILSFTHSLPMVHAAFTSGSRIRKRSASSTAVL